MYLNLIDPANCSGTLSSYRYCHYPTTLGNPIKYNAIFAVFRMKGDTYVPLMGSEAAVEVTTIEPFSCSASMPVASVLIEPGDVVGVCVGPRQGANREQLNLAGNATGFSVSGVSVNGNCPTNDLSSVTVTISELVQFSGMILHLSAEISELLNYDTRLYLFHRSSNPTSNNEPTNSR